MQPALATRDRSDLTSVDNAATSPLRHKRSLSPLVVCLVLWAALLIIGGGIKAGPRTRNFGGDFALNVTGAVIQHAGGNPYDEAQVIATQQSFFARQGIRTPNDKMTKMVTWQSYPPLYYWLLQPLSRLPFRVIGSLWIGILYASMGAGFLSILHLLGWHRRLIPTLLFLAMPQTMLQAFYGNAAALVFAMIGAALFLQRRHPVLAGMLISASWLKPQLGVPAMVLITLFHVDDRRGFAGGIVLGSTALLAASLGTVGLHSLLQWIAEMRTVSAMAGGQPNMIALVGLYGGVVSDAVRQILQYALLGSAVVVTGWWWLKLRPVGAVPPLQVGWLWVVWLLALPYCHFPEEMLLAMPVLALLGRDGCRMVRSAVFVLYLMFATVILFYNEPFNIQMLSLPLIALGIILFRASSDSGSCKPGALPRSLNVNHRPAATLR